MNAYPISTRTLRSSLLNTTTFLTWKYQHFVILQKISLNGTGKQNVHTFFSSSGLFHLDDCCDLGHFLIATDKVRKVGALLYSVYMVQYLLEAFPQGRPGSQYTKYVTQFVTLIMMFHPQSSFQLKQTLAFNVCQCSGGCSLSSHPEASVPQW